MFQWVRIPLKDAAGTATTDTTEVQIGGDYAIPTWAKGLWAAHFQLNPLALTDKEEISGYFRIIDGNESLKPLNLPIPINAVLTGAIGTHIAPLGITLPCMHSIEPNDTLAAYMALDAATTGAHVAALELLLSSIAPPLNMHVEKSAATAFGQTAGTLTTAVDIKTVARKTAAIIGAMSTFLVYPTAAETFAGHMKIESDEEGWLTQRLPTPTLGSGLSTQITPYTLPVVSLPIDLKPWINQAMYVPWLEEYPVAGNGKATFSFQNTPIQNQTVAGAGRYFLAWRE